MSKKEGLEELRNYEDKWVALREPTKQVVGSGNDASEARRDAERKGFRDVILLKVLPLRGYYVPAA